MRTERLMFSYGQQVWVKRNVDLCKRQKTGNTLPLKQKLNAKVKRKWIRLSLLHIGQSSGYKKGCFVLSQWLECLSLMHALDLSLFCNRHNFIPHKSNLCFQRE